MTNDLIPILMDIADKYLHQVVDILIMLQMEN